MPDFHHRRYGFRYKGRDFIDRDSIGEATVISRFVRWPVRILLVLLVLVIAALAGLRIAAALRETATRETLAAAGFRVIALDLPPFGLLSNSRALGSIEV